MTLQFKVRAAEVRTYGTENKEYIAATAGTTYGKPVHTNFFEDYQVAMFKEAIDKNTLHLLEPIPGNIGVVDTPAHFRKNRKGETITDDKGNPVIYTKVAVFYMEERGEDAATQAGRLYRDFIKAGAWEVAAEGAPSDSAEPIM